MRWRSIFLFILAAILGSCATPRHLECRAGERLLTLDTLYFGTGTPAGPVSQTQWQAFVTHTVSAEFPKGYTVVRGEGAWRADHGELQHEDSYMLQLVHEDNGGAEHAIARIIGRYKEDFRQESVMRVRAATCASF